MIRYGLILAACLSLVACGGKTTESKKSVPVGPPQPLLNDFSCQISLAGAPSQLKVGGESEKITVKVVNDSAATWAAMLQGRNTIGVVNVAYHWSLDGQDVVEGERAFLKADLVSKQAANVELSVAPPPKEGNYVLRVEPVQEGVAWFSSLGGCKAEVPVKAVR